MPDGVQSEESIERLDVCCVVGKLSEYIDRIIEVSSLVGYSPPNTAHSYPFK